MYGPDPVMDRQRPDKRLVVPAGSTAILSLQDRDVFVSATTNDTGTVVLPNVSEAKGYTFRVHGIGISAGSSADAVIKFMDGTGAANSTTVNTTDVVVDFYSNGREWVSRRTAV